MISVSTGEVSLIIHVGSCIAVDDQCVHCMWMYREFVKIQVVKCKLLF